MQCMALTRHSIDGTILPCVLSPVVDTQTVTGERDRSPNPIKNKLFVWVPTNAEEGTHHLDLEVQVGCEPPSVALETEAGLSSTEQPL